MLKSFKFKIVAAMKCKGRSMCVEAKSILKLKKLQADCGFFASPHEVWYIFFYRLYLRQFFSDQ